MRVPGVAERIENLEPESVLELLVIFVPGDGEPFLVLVVHLHTWQRQGEAGKEANENFVKRVQACSILLLGGMIRTIRDAEDARGRYTQNERVD